MKPVAFLLPFALLASSAMAQHVKVEAVADRTAVKPGETFIVALHYTIEPGWHIYWQNPGETGTPPRAKWKLPNGVTVGEPQFPTPERMTSAVTAFGYEKQTAVLYAVTVPDSATSAIELQANVNWVVCSDEACVSERQNVAISVPLGEGQPNQAEAFATWKAEQPARPSPLPVLIATVDADGKHATVELPAGKDEQVLDFFPPKSDELEFTKPKIVNGKWLVEIRLLAGAPDKFEGTGIVVINKSDSSKPTSTEVCLTYRLPKPFSFKE